MCLCLSRKICCLVILTFIIAAIMIYWERESISHVNDKKQQAVWRLECELGIISNEECPVDGGWGSWSPWSACHGTCDDIGHRRRNRHCTNPPPSNDGLPCKGPEEGVETCYPSNCTVDSFKALIAGDPARLQEFKLLEVVPAMMERCLETECPFEAIEAALSNDNTWQLNAENLWSALQCVKRNLGCPVVGEWGSWGSWSSCGARCGHGLRWQLRRCDSPPPSQDLLFCEGTPLVAEPCEGNQCADGVDFSKDSENNWSEWGLWTSCSEKCGPGVQRRQRVCQEKTTNAVTGSWGTHCVGQHDQFKICKNDECVMDGSWSGWGAWGPCSQTCGAGRKSRMRSCTRPTPSGGGKPCTGPRTEISSCYLKPCEARSHTIAIFNGDSYLHYNLTKKRSTLFHFFVRFMAQAPNGIIVRRGSLHNPLVRLSLQKWHLCLEANGSKRSCKLPRICTSSTIDLAVWHSALASVTNSAATLRVDDSRVPLTATFDCDPEFEEEALDIKVGEKFHGAIQELALNFIPLKLLAEKENSKSDFVPSSASNIVYEKAELDEAFLHINDGQYLLIPCSNDEYWHLKLTVWPNKESGTLLFMSDNLAENWFHVSLQNRRLKLKLALGDFKLESVGVAEYGPDQWLDIALTWKRESNLIEASINADEKIHIILDDMNTRRRRVGQLFKRDQKIDLTSNKCTDSHDVTKSIFLKICKNEYYFGGLPIEIKHRLEEDFTPFFGVVASLKTNGHEPDDLHQVHMERYHDGSVQVSSRTASISGSYHETTWGKSNRLNLSCLHARKARSPNSAQWLFLDTGFTKATLQNKFVRSIDDGKILKLVASAENDLRGFYTCRALNTRRTRNIITYGVIGRIKSHLSGPDTITVLAVITTFALVATTIGWLIMEGSNDLKTGFGFFRDAHLTPEEEAEAVCKFIDENLHFYASKSVAELAKEKARWRGQKMASRLSFAAQEPQGLVQTLNKFDDNSSTSEPELPALPEVKSYMVAPHHEIFRCEPCYISSPQHGSFNISPRTRQSSSSVEFSSPRLLCSRLLMPRFTHSSRETVSRRRNQTITKKTTKPRSQLLTIKSSAFYVSPGHKVLEKFHQLKAEDL